MTTTASTVVIDTALITAIDQLAGVLGDRVDILRSALKAAQAETPDSWAFDVAINNAQRAADRVNEIGQTVLALLAQIETAGF